MYLTAETVTVDDDEGRFTLEILDDEGDRHSFIIHHIDLDAFYDQVKGRIGPYLQERDQAQRRMDLAQNMKRSMREAYGLYDPKHPRYHFVHADHYDSRMGK